MDIATREVKIFEDQVLTKYHLYRSLLLSLPFEQVREDGSLLSLFAQHVEKHLDLGLDVKSTVEDFFKNQSNYQDFSSPKIIKTLFRFIQFIEREVTLFDAIEEVAFSKLIDRNGEGTLHNLMQVFSLNKKFSYADFDRALKDYQLRIVLTAHPTQFYPPPVLNIIKDIKRALRRDNISLIHDLLKQLGKTPFRSSKKPTPLDEAESLIVFLEEVFYNAIPTLQKSIEKKLEKVEGAENFKHQLVTVGFWPGGDRDGNPFVTAEVMVKVAYLLKRSLIGCYIADLKQLIKRLTFANVYVFLKKVLEKLIATLGNQEEGYLNYEQFLKDLLHVKSIMEKQHDSLFIDLLEDFIRKIECFQFYFASIDIRQNSASHHRVVLEIFDSWSEDWPEAKSYDSFDEEKRIEFLLKAARKLKTDRKKVLKLLEEKNGFAHECIKTISNTKSIRKSNGELGLYRYIISNTCAASNIVELFFLFVMGGYDFSDIPFDIIPLFETIDDLEHSQKIMAFLYKQKWYCDHLKKRGSRQVIMLGFSDGTKDGGYFACNWMIYKAKENLSLLTRKENFRVIFFDGRGGPPSRGGGNTRRFYTSLSKNVKNQQVQITIQGQTISSNFADEEKASYNMEQLFTAGIENKLEINDAELSKDDRKIFDEMAHVSMKKYHKLKEHPAFLSYLQVASPLLYYNETNIASRPSTRSLKKDFDLKDLRAIPFVTAWAMLKQVVPAFYGFGTALAQIKKMHPDFDLCDFYNRSPFFQTIIGNSMQSLVKTDFRLTACYEKDDRFSGIWRDIKNEAELTKKMIISVSKQKLLQDQPINLLSIKTRESIVRPLIVLQQYALQVIDEMDRKKRDDANRRDYEKLVVRTLPGAVNAGRNSA